MIFNLATSKQITTLLRRYGGILLLWSLGLIVSFSVFFLVNYYEKQQDKQQFESSFKDKITSLTQAVSAIDKVFLATQSLLAITPPIKQEDFAHLVTTKFLANTGMQGIEWVPSISKAEQTIFEEGVRKSGLFDYQIRSMNANGSVCNEQSKQFIYPVLFAEPADVIGHESGLELTSDCKLASKLLSALNSQKITSADFLNEQNELGIRLLLPVFETSENNNRNLRGYIVGIVMINQLIDSLWGNITSSDDEQLIIYNSGDNQKIYDSIWREQCEQNCKPPLNTIGLQASIPFANQVWSIEFSKNALGSRSDYYAYAAALAILVIISGASIYLWANINRARWANSLVAQRTKSLQHQANHDDLTNLLNKQALSVELEKLNEPYARRSDDGYSLLFIDLDHFKKVNDTKGHLIGDKLLQQVAQRLIKSARADDLLFRFGGDEFAVLLAQGKYKHIVSSAAERILQELEQVYLIDNDKYRIGASIGATMITDEYTSVSELIRNADIAMYEAKKRGRGQVVFYQANMHKNLMYRQNIENELEDAIYNDELSLYLQPIHSKSHLIGFEALTRWNHPQKGMIYPDDFINVAEETGLIHPLGHWLIEATCKQLSKWIDHYGKEACPYISLNISPLQLANSHIVEQIETALARYNISAQLLAIELTESALIDNKKIVKENLILLRQLSVKVFLDDFGTGYSSLSLLQHFPIDILKIDRSFISGVEANNQESQNLVKAMITMANALNMKVVAEGVESSDTLNWLASEQCDLMQGYYFSKPLAQEKLSDYMDEFLLKQKPFAIVSNG